jgi:hypothetical protein
MWLVVGTVLLLAAAVCTLETNSSSRRTDPYACVTSKYLTYMIFFSCNILHKSPFGTIQQFAVFLFHSWVDLLHQTQFVNTSLSLLVHASTHTEVHQASCKASSTYIHPKLMGTIIMDSSKTRQLTTCSDFKKGYSSRQHKCVTVNLVY